PAVLMDQSDDTTIYKLDAVVDTMSEGVTAADGKCLSPLSSAGESNPFGAAKQTKVTLTRVPSMHSAGDDEAVVEFFGDGRSMGSDMSPAWFLGPKDLIATKPLSPATYTGFGHGTPGSIPNLTVSIVKGGGMACVP